MNWLVVFIGGGIGSIFRYGIGRIVNTLFPGINFPWATFISNLLSCMLFALTMVFIIPRVKDQQLIQLLLLTGICGGFSTFSTFSYETFQLFQRQEYLIAIANILCSVLVCLLVFLVLLKKL